MKEALKLALQALEDLPGFRADIDNAITAIKEALAQPAQEPVAIDWEHVARVQNAKLMAMCDQPGGMDKLREVLLAAAPQPAQRTWVGLTEQELKSAYWGYMEVPTQNGFEKTVKALETKLKEKNT